MTDQILALVAHAIRHRTPFAAVTAESTFRQLGVDAIDAWTISCAIEQALGVELVDAEIESWRSVAEVIASVEKLQSAA